MEGGGGRYGRRGRGRQTPGRAGGRGESGAMQNLTCEKKTLRLCNCGLVCNVAPSHVPEAASFTFRMTSSSRLPRSHDEQILLCTHDAGSGRTIVHCMHGLRPA